jgi:DNA-binding response OmpR family regulator
MRIALREDDDRRRADVQRMLGDAGFAVRPGSPRDLVGGALLVLDVGVAELPGLLERLGQGASGGALRLDSRAHAARVGDRQARLTPTEFRLLSAFLARPGACLRRHELASLGWPDGAIVHPNTLDAYMARLRRKLRRLDAETQIVTLRGVGYALRQPVN